MSQRKRGISLPQLSILSSPDSTEPAIKNGTRAGAECREVDAMEAIAQARPRAKDNTFGIADPHNVTDLDKIKVDPIVAATLERAAEESARYAYHGRVEMTARQWAAIPPNPRQRDTEAHARKAKHLRVYDPIHRFVNMARTTDGRMFKLDGHTRSYVWAKGEVQGPATVYVDVYLCADEAAVKALYSKFDSQVAVETGADKIVGAAREHGLTFRSPMLRAGRYGSAVKRLYMLTTKAWGQWTEAQFVYDAIGFYKMELRLLDRLAPQHRQFSSGIIMAALATYKRRGLRLERVGDEDKVVCGAGPRAAFDMKVEEFWQEFAAERGVKEGVRMDGVCALQQALARTREHSARGDGGAAFQVDLLGKGILAVEAYRTGETYKSGKGGGIRNMDDDVLKEYLRRSVEG